MDIIRMESLVIIGILGKQAISPLAQPVKIFTYKTLFFKDFTCNLVSLHNFGAFKFRIIITGAPIFIVSLCGGSTEEKNYKIFIKLPKLLSICR